MPSTDILEIASNLREFTRKDVEVNWTTADAVVRSRECLCESLCTVWKKWQALAAKNGWSVERLLRNVRARARDEELPFLEKVIELALEDAPGEPTRSALQTLKLSFPKEIPSLAHYILKSTGTTLPLSVLSAHTPDWLKCMEAVTLHASSRPTPYEFIRILITFHPESRQTGSQYLGSESFASKWSKLGWPMLTGRMFSRLPPETRERILCNPAASGRLHSPGGILDITAATSSGDYASPLFLKAILRFDRDLRIELTRKCVPGHPALSCSTGMRLADVRRITAGLPKHTAAAWRYLLTPPEAWVGMLRRGRESGLFTLPVDIGHVLEKLSAVSSARPKDYETVLKEASGKSGSKIFDAVMNRFKDGEGVPKSLLKSWLVFLGKNQLVKAILSRPGDFSFLREGDFGRLPKAIREPLAASVSDVASMRSVLRCIGKTLSGFLVHNRAHALSWAKAVYKNEKQAGTATQAIEYLGGHLAGSLTHLEWVRIIPDAGGLAELRDTIKRHPFGESVGDMRNSVCALVRRLYSRALHDEGGARAMYFLSQCVADLGLTLEEAGCSSFSVPEMAQAIPLRESFAGAGSLLGAWKLFNWGFKDLEQRIGEKSFRHLEADLKSGGARLCLQAYQKLPRKFTRLVTEVVPLDFVWPLSHDNAVLAHALERKYGRGAMLKLLPEIRTRFAQNPVLRCAYELAACFSLADAGYLVHLSRTVVKAAGQFRATGGVVFEDLYTRTSIPKKSGAMRLITAPKPLLKRLQKRILQNGLSHLPLPDSCHGFREGRSIVTNAAPHAGSRLVVNVDIRAFFPSTSRAQVKQVLWKHYSKTLSDSAIGLLSEICCLDGSLPTGAPTSPVLANLVLAPVDRALEKAAARFGVTYTRYADDLTFSGNEDCKKILPLVRKLLAQRGYVLDPEKTQLYRRGRRQMVTGLVVNDKPNVPRKIRRLLRACVHRSAGGAPPVWDGQPMSKSSLRGRIAQLARVQPEEFRAFKSKLDQAT